MILIKLNQLIIINLVIIILITIIIYFIIIKVELFIIKVINQIIFVLNKNFSKNFQYNYYLKFVFICLIRFTIIIMPFIVKHFNLTFKAINMI